MPKINPSAKDLKASAKRLTQAVEACEPRLSRIQLAAKLAVTPGAVSHYLNGDRACPAHIVSKIARITNVEPGWLLHGSDSKSEARTPTAASPIRRTRPSQLKWGFRESPADGGKDFGNAAVYATPMAVKTIVREDGQNSLDAAPRSEVTIRFRLVELAPNTKRYERVLRSLRFDALQERIEAIEAASEFESKLGTKLAAGLEHILEERLLLLFVDDFGTRGMQGGEFDSTKSFAALARDNLNSRKEEQTAGGVFGLGAKVNIACSQLSTVIFASKVKGEEANGIRIIGRSELTYHKLGSGRGATEFAGPGWLGRAGATGAIESAWVSEDDQLLDDLMIRRDRLPIGVRPSDSSGTTIMVVGFADPQTESGGSTQQLADSFVEAAAINFWPAMMRGSLSIWVERFIGDDNDPVKSEKVDPRSVPGVSQLCDAWDKHVSGNETPVLIAPGDVACVTVPLTVPATKPRARGVKSHDEITADCQLIVRLAEPDDAASDPRVGHVAYVRGRAMVTRYQPRSGSVGGRPFHAMLLAGTLVGRGAEQVAAEQFLRMAEPPAHDRWSYNADLGERFARGGRKALDEFHSRVTEELQKLLRPLISRSNDGPEALKRLLQIRPAKQGTTKQPQVRIANSSATVVDGAWRIDAELVIDPTTRVLRITPRLLFQCEGAAAIPVSWNMIQVEDGDASVNDHVLIAQPRTKRLSFRGWSDPRSHPVEASQSSVLLDVIGRVEEDA